MNRYDSIYTVDLTSVVLNYNYLLLNLVGTRHLKPWYTKHKMSVDDSRQKNGWNMYLQGTVMR